MNQEDKATADLLGAIGNLRAITIRADIDAGSDAYVAAVRRFLLAFFGGGMRVDVIASASESIDLTFDGVPTYRGEAALMGHVRTFVEMARAFA